MPGSMMRTAVCVALCAVTLLPACYRALVVAPPHVKGAAAASPSALSMSIKKVLVTGAGGKTGKLVFAKLLEKEGVTPVGLVRSKKSAKSLKKLGGKDENIAMGDILDKESLKEAMKGVNAVILCSSATPKIVFSSILKIMLKKLFRKEPGRPKFKWPERGQPSLVDYDGAINQIDLAKEEGVQHFVFLSSMGGTQKDNFLNTIGKEEDGTGGDILIYKRKAEEYLVGSGLPYTILHPGGLVDKPGGARQLLVDVDDKLLKGTNRQVPRADVAELCVQSLFAEECKNRSFDLASMPEGEGTVTKDIKSLIGGLEGKNCDYNIKPQ